MENLKELRTPELYRFSGYLEALGRCIIGADYETHFETAGFELSGEAFVAERIIRKAYPASKTEKGNIVDCSSEQMIERVHQALKLPDPPYSEITFRNEIQKNLVEGYWKHLKACVDHETARILEYRPSQGADDELWDFIYWGFTFLIYSEEKRRCLIIHGGASD